MLYEYDNQKNYFTARSLRSLETQRSLRIFIIVFSPERGENTMVQALRAKAINIFIDVRYLYQNSPLRNSDKILSLRSLRLCGETVFGQE